MKATHKYRWQVLDVALRLHMCSTGALDYHDSMVDECAWLAQRIEDWKPGRPQQRVFDNAVYELCMTALGEYCAFEERMFKP